MVWLIVIIAELNVFILLQGCTCYPYVPSKDLNYNQGVETRRIIEQPSSENNAFMRSKVPLWVPLWVHPLVSLTALAVSSPSYLARHALQKLHLILSEENNDNMMVICRKKRKVKAFFSYFTSVARSRLIWTLNKSEPNLRSFYPPPPPLLPSLHQCSFSRVFKAT